MSQQFRRYFIACRKRENKFYIIICTLSKIQNEFESFKKRITIIDDDVTRRDEKRETSRSIGKLEYSSRIDRESSRDRARGRTEEVDGERRQTESKREEEENFQFCSTAGLPSGNFETNWLSRVYANRWALISSLGPLNPEAPWSRTGRKGEEREGERGWRISGSCTGSFHARSPKLLTNITILNTK